MLVIACCSVMFVRLADDISHNLIHWHTMGLYQYVDMTRNNDTNLMHGVELEPARASWVLLRRSRGKTLPVGKLKGHDPYVFFEGNLVCQEKQNNALLYCNLNYRDRTKKVGWDVVLCASC